MLVVGEDCAVQAAFAFRVSGDKATVSMVAGGGGQRVLLPSLFACQAQQCQLSATMGQCALPSPFKCLVASSGLPQRSLPSLPQDLLFRPERSTLHRPPRQCLSFPFATLCVMSWTVLPSASDASSLTDMLVVNTTAVVIHRRLAEVSNWGALKTACGSSGTVTLSDGFVMGTYTLTPGPQYGGIDFSGKQLVIIGNSKTLDAGEKG
jgi:hypothetical protein